MGTHSHLVIAPLRFALACVVVIGLFSGPVAAQTPSPKPVAEAKGENWKSLGEADEPDEPVAPSGDEPRYDDSGNPYRPAEMPPPSREVETDEPDEANEGHDEPEVIAWMRKDWKPLALTRHVRAEMDVGLFDLADAYTWDVVAQLGFDDVPAFLDVDIPVGLLTVDGVDDKAVMGNVVIGGHGGDVVASGKLGLWGGLLIAIPTTVDPEDRSGLAVSALSTSSMLRGGIDSHRFAPLNVPIRGDFGLAWQIYPLVYYRFQVAGSAWVSTLDDAQRGGRPAVRGFLEFINDVEALSPWGPGLGVRLQAWVDATQYSGGLGGLGGLGLDRDQLAIEPYITYRPPFSGPLNVPVFARLGFLLPIDGGLFDETLRALNNGDDGFVLRAMLGGRF